MNDKKDNTERLEIVKKVREFSVDVGARAVWQAWRNTMIEQGRNVASKRMSWYGLAEIDKQLDAEIAFQVVAEFLIWAGEMKDGTT